MGAFRERMRPPRPPFLSATTLSPHKISLKRTIKACLLQKIQLVRQQGPIRHWKQGLGYGTLLDEYAHTATESSSQDHRLELLLKAHFDRRALESGLGQTRSKYEGSVKFRIWTGNENSGTAFTTTFPGSAATTSGLRQYLISVKLYS